MKRDFPLSPTPLPQGEPNKKKMARQENRQIRKEERAEARQARKIERSTGLEYEPRVTKRQIRKWTPLIGK